MSFRQPPIKTPRLYQQIADKLARSIAAGEYTVGERLPAERELAVTYDVSRPTIREAIIALELEGIVDVKMGSGVYVIAMPRAGVHEVAMDMGPFELTEARLLIEGEVAALAAALITDRQLEELEKLLQEMQFGNQKSEGEIADRKFHALIADATRNSAMVSIVESLWIIHERSPQCARLFEQTKANGHQPIVAEHRAILDALRAHDAGAARVAMQNHLRRVLNYLIDATEVAAIAETRSRIAAQRSRFNVLSRR